MSMKLARIFGILLPLCWAASLGLASWDPEIREIVLTTQGCEAEKSSGGFSASDAYIYCIAKVKVYRNAPRSSYDVIVEWYAPDGSLYFREDFDLKRPTTITPPISVCSRLAVRGTKAACLGGTWRVSVTIPFGDRKSTSFTLISPENQPPKAQLSWSYLEERTVRFDATGSYDEDGKIVSYQWDFGDGYQGQGPVVTHQYARDGDYPVLLRITDNCGALVEMKKTVSVPPLPPNQPPVANFMCPSQVRVGESATFDASGSYDPDGSIVSFSWRFGDGGVGYGTSVTHQYQAAGTYTVTLTVTDNAGAKATASKIITVVLPVNQRPVAHLAWDISQPNPNQPVTFDASGSYDPDGTIRSYLWDFDGDGRVDLVTQEVTVTHAYPTCGDKQVTLRVVDDQGASSSSETRSLHVNCPPKARFSWTPRVPKPGALVQLDATSSRDLDGQVVSYTWDFGDGSPAEFGAQVSHSYATCGRYTVKLTVVDDGGLSHEIAQVVRVNCSPVAGFDWSPEVPSAGAPVTFTAVRDSTLSYDPDGTIVSYTWDFGDGTPPVTMRPPSTSVTHSYAQCGSYVVTLTVTDADGAATVASQDVRVNCPPVATFTWTPEKPSPGEVVTFDASSSHDPDGVITSYTWRFGDGTPPVTVAIPQIEHRFERYGTFTVQLAVVDAEGAARTTSSQIAVQDLVPPSSQATMPPPTCQYGWYNGPVAVTIAATDNDAVAAIRYRVNGEAIRSVSGSPVVVQVTAEGTSTIEYWAEDRSGNEERPHNFVAVSIDRSKPTIDVQVPSPGASFYLNEPVTPQVRVADAVSEVVEQTIDPSIDTSSVGRHTFTAKATDRACNEATVARTYYVRYRAVSMLPFEQELEWLLLPPEGLRGRPTRISLQVTPGDPLILAIAFFDFYNSPVKPEVLPTVQVIAVRGSGSAESYSPVHGLGGTLVYNDLSQRYEMTVPTFGLARGVYELWVTTEDGGIHRLRFQMM